MENTNKSLVGSSYHDSCFNATVNQLKEILGPPKYYNNDGEGKSNFVWDKELDTGEPFSIYDYKYYHVIDEEEEEIEWHIGGQGASVTRKALAEIKELLNKI